VLGRHRCYRLTPRCWDTLTEEWWQWAYSLPYTAHPLFDTADASAGQHGKVWFLGGNFTGAADTRTAVIPRGKFLFFPILNTMMDDTDCSVSGRTVDPYTVAQLRALLTPSMDGAHAMSCTIDGVPVPGLSDAAHSHFRVHTPSPQGFSYAIPGQDSLNVLFGYPCWSDKNGAPIRVEAKKYHAVGDGYYLMVAPLAPGAHTIHIQGTTATGYTQDETYNLTVLAHDGD